MIGTAAVHVPDAYSNESPYRTVWNILESVIERVDAQDQAERIAQTYSLLCSESLRLPPSQQYGRRSVITECGVPFEFSFTTADSPGTVRMLSEVAPASATLADRVGCTLECLEQLICVHGLFGDRQTVQDLLDQILPSNLPDFDSCWSNGAIWLSVRFARQQSPVLRVYVNQHWNDNAFRFVNGHKLLTHLRQSRNAERLLKLFHQVEDWADIAGVSFDIGTAGIGAVKLYLGASAATAEHIVELLRTMSLSHRIDEALLFLEKMMLVANHFAGPCLLLSVVFPSVETEPLALKMDVTTRVVFDCDRLVYEAVDDVLQCLRLHAMGYRACEDLFFPHGFPSGRVQILQYVGLALRATGPPRVNIYLAPPYP